MTLYFEVVSKEDSVIQSYGIVIIDMGIIQDSKNYLSELAKRKKESHVHREYQFVGLEVAGLLGDPGHKALYIKLVKIHGKDRILPLAKDIADRKNIRNKGAYFMKMLTGDIET